jgi:hypothetical protein
VSVTTSPHNSEIHDPCADRIQSEESEWKAEPLKVSQQDGAVLARPALSDVAGLYAQNRDLLSDCNCEIQGESLSELRVQTRDELLDLAVAYTSQIRQEPVTRPDFEGLICDGHQPLLFHSGVWAKNFVLGGLAKKLKAPPLHLIVDNDAWSQSGVMVPVNTTTAPTKQQIAYATVNGDQPWEETLVDDLNMFSAFGESVSDVMAECGVEPLIHECWPLAVDAAKKNWPLSDCLTVARHHMERRWGLENLELPMSRVCDSNSFRKFFCHLVSHMPCFREIYNQVLGEYRKVNGVRSHTHPVPELKEREGWLESPFWVWNTNSTQRLPLFVKQEGHQILLASDANQFASLELSPELKPERALEQLQTLFNEGWRIRSRALTTTLFARLYLSDLFIHGIGGAKYDEMTDRLMSRFYGVDAPGYLTLSGTWHLPLNSAYDLAEDRKQSLQQELRDLKYNPERILGDSFPEEMQSLCDEKQTLIDEQKRVEAGERLGDSQREHHRRGCERYRRLKAINKNLAQIAGHKQNEFQKELDQVQSRIDANQILNSREYSFVLFPEEKLKTAMTALTD